MTESGFLAYLTPLFSFQSADVLRVASVVVKEVWLKDFLY